MLSIFNCKASEIWHAGIRSQKTMFYIWCALFLSSGPGCILSVFQLFFFFFLKLQTLTINCTIWRLSSERMVSLSVPVCGHGCRRLQLKNCERLKRAVKSGQTEEASVGEGGRETGCGWSIRKNRGRNYVVIYKLFSTSVHFITVFKTIHDTTASSGNV